MPDPITPAEVEVQSSVTGLEAPETPQTPEVMKPFDSLQQAKVEKLIRAAKSESAKDLRATHARTLQEVETLRKSLNLPQETIDHLEATNAKLLEAKQEYARFDGLNKAQKKREALQSAALSVNFYDPLVGATILAGEVTYEGDVLIVINPATGEGRMNSQGENMTIAELAREKSSAHPYMIRSMLKGGVGSVAGSERTEDPYPVELIFGPFSDGGVAQRLMRENPRKYATLRRTAVEKGLVR